MQHPSPHRQASYQRATTLLDMAHHSQLRQSVQSRACINRFLKNLKQVPDNSRRISKVVKAPQLLTRTEKRTSFLNITHKQQHTSKQKTATPWVEKSIRSYGIFIDQHGIIRYRGLLGKPMI